jgi:hypothetical protein
MTLSPKVKEILHGAVVAIGGAVSAVIVPVLNSGTLPTGSQLKSAGVIGIGAGLAYLIKNLLLGSGTTPQHTDAPKP